MKNIQTRISRSVCLILPLMVMILSLTACVPFEINQNTLAPTPRNATLSPATLTPTPGQTTLSIVPATITRSGGDTLAMTVELARTSQEQETGLMGRTTLPADRGMLFIFPQPGLVGFWMKDTLIALSVAFIDANGQIIDIQEMEPMSETVHQPNRNYLYALEVPKGYFAAKNIKPGDKFTFKS